MQNPECMCMGILLPTALQNEGRAGGQLPLQTASSFYILNHCLPQITDFTPVRPCELGLLGVLGLPLHRNQSHLSEQLLIECRVSLRYVRYRVPSILRSSMYVCMAQSQEKSVKTERASERASLRGRPARLNKHHQAPAAVSPLPSANSVLPIPQDFGGEGTFETVR